MSLARLRQEARLELDTVIEHRCRAGDDPWEFLPELPSVDEQVVATLRAEAIEERGLEDERSRAYHPSSPAEQAERFEFRLLRAIALEHPPLTRAVWSMLDRVER